MKISLNWLKQYVEIDVKPSSLADMLTMAGFEVEAIINPYAHLDHVVVGRIAAVEPHPKADRLARCSVDTGNRTYNVVCGAPNARTGMLAPFALPGTLLASGTKVEHADIRGETSEGMLCSETELELGSDASGLMVLDASLSPGTPLAEALDLYDTIFEIGLTPNRPDCLSFIGVAREVAALLGKTLKRPRFEIPEGDGRISEHTSVTIENPELCPRYAARLITGISIGESPPWLQKRLMSIGLKPINNIVDITNFVMMETGQPLHAFDFDRLAGHRIVVRTPKHEKTFVTLDGKSRNLQDDTLMICDSEKPVAVAGVMGGENSEISHETTRVLLESACFDPISIRKTAKLMGISTDASHRFERGVDPRGTVDAAGRAAALMVEIAGGLLVKGTIDEHPRPASHKIVPLNIAKTNRHLGTDLTAEQIIDFLEAVDFSVTRTDTDNLEVIAPSFRVDVDRPEDLMEEVARLWGYNNIVTTFPHISACTEPPKKALEVKSDIKDLMTGFGFSEAINYSFIGIDSARRLEISDDDPRHRELPILNPLAETQAVMRTSLLPALIESIQKNLFRQELDLRLFELGKVFYSKGKEALPEETEMLAGVWTGNRSPRNWLQKPEACDFYDIKGVIEALLTGLGVKDVLFTRMPDHQCSYTHPGQTARISCGDLIIGSAGEIKPSVLKRFDVKQPVFSFEININSLIELVPETISFTPVPRFPSVARDLTLIVDKQVETGVIIDRVKSLDRELDIELVEDVSVFDVYQGKPIPEDKKSTSIRIVYRSQGGTLEDERVNTIHQKITRDLMTEFNAGLPS